MHARWKLSGPLRLAGSSQLPLFLSGIFSFLSGHDDEYAIANKNVSQPVSSSRRECLLSSVGA